MSSRGADAEFLETCVRDEQVAYSRLIRLLGKQQPFPLLTQMAAIFHEHDVHLPREATNRAIIFLANAWTQDGKGLFAPSVQANLNIALGCAITQYILPWARVANNKSSLLFTRLNRLLRSHGLEYAISPHD